MRRRHRRAHRIAWMVLAVALPLALLVPLALRPSGPRETVPLRLGTAP